MKPQTNADTRRYNQSDLLIALNKCLSVFFWVCVLSVFLVNSAVADVMHFQIDPDASEISATVDEPMSSIRGSAVGTFRVVSGDAYGDDANVQGTGRLTIVLDAASYRSSSSFRDHAVKGSVLEAGSFPTISFASTAVEDVAMVSKREGTATIAGNLTLHGMARPIRMPVKASIDAAGRLVVDGEVAFRYEQFGIKPPSLMFGAMTAGDVATVKFHVVATRAQ